MTEQTMNTSDQRILILFAHPMIHRSNVNSALIDAIKGLENVTVHDLYAAYPDLYIDVAYEQQLLHDHDIIVFQHPFYWYSAPAIIKIWQDLVLQYGFAYGAEGTALHGKYFMSVITAGASISAYQSDAVNRYSVEAFLRPTEQMAHFTGMQYLPPFVIYGTHRILQRDIQQQAAAYRQLLIALSKGRLPKDEAEPDESWADWLIQWFGGHHG